MNVLGLLENRASSYGKGNDARIVPWSGLIDIRLSRYKGDSPLKSLNRNPLTIYETGFVTVEKVSGKRIIAG